MTDVAILQNRIEAVIDLYRKDEGLTTGEVMGVLETVKLNIWQESLEDD